MKILYDELNNLKKNAVDEAIGIKGNAHAPISNFKVGSAILTDDGEIYTGVNVEISSFSPTICAERNAIFSYFSSGGRNFNAIFINSTGKNTFPCGVCRQVIYELSPNCEVYIVNGRDDIRMFEIGDLMPHGFRWEE